MRWSDGNDFCAEQVGSTLATITSDDDAQIILDLAKSGTNVWVGLRETDGKWSWASGYQCEKDDCSTLKYWGKGEPNGRRGGESCAWNGDGRSDIDNMLDNEDCDVDFKVACDLSSPLTFQSENKKSIMLSGVLAKTGQGVDL